MARFFQIKSIKDLAQQYFSEYIRSEEGDRKIELLSHAEWVEIVGERVAQHAKPLHIDQGTLIVKTDHASWNHYILLNSNAIISAFAAARGRKIVHSIKVKSA